jgi:hypothetical protein
MKRLSISYFSFTLLYFHIYFSISLLSPLEQPVKLERQPPDGQSRVKLNTSVELLRLEKKHTLVHEPCYIYIYIYDTLLCNVCTQARKTKVLTKLGPLSFMKHDDTLVWLPEHRT